MSSRNYSFQRNQESQLISEQAQSQFINKHDKFLEEGLESEESEMDTANNQYKKSSKKAQKYKGQSHNSYDRKAFQERTFDQNPFYNEQLYNQNQRQYGKIPQSSSNQRSNSQSKQYISSTQSTLKKLENALQKQLSNQEMLMNYKSQLQLNVNHAFEDVDNKYIHLKNQLEIYYQDALAQIKLIQKNKNHVLDQKLNITQSQIQQINRAVNRLSSNLKRYSSNEISNQISPQTQEVESLIRTQLIDLDIPQDFPFIQEQDIALNFALSKKQNLNTQQRDQEASITKDKPSHKKESSKKKKERVDQQNLSSSYIKKSQDQKQSPNSKNKSSFQHLQQPQADKNHYLIPESASSKSNYLKNKSFEGAQPTEISQLNSKNPSFLLPEFETNEFQKEMENLENEIDNLKQQKRKASKTQSQSKLLDFQELEKKRKQILERSKPFLESVKSETESDSGENTQKSTPKDIQLNQQNESPTQEQSLEQNRKKLYSKGSAREKYQINNEGIENVEKKQTQREMIKANKQLAERIENLEVLLTNFSKSPTSNADQQVQTIPSQVFPTSAQNISQFMFTEPEQTSHIIISQLKTEDVDQILKNQIASSPIFHETGYENTEFSASKQNLVFQSQGKWNKVNNINIRVYVPHGYPPYSCYYTLTVAPVISLLLELQSRRPIWSSYKASIFAARKMIPDAQKKLLGQRTSCRSLLNRNFSFWLGKIIIQAPSKKDWPRMFLREKL